MKSRWLKIALITAGWALVGLVLSLELYFNERAMSRGADSAWKQADFWELATPQFVRAMMWAALAPLILKLRERVPLHRGRWIGGITFHALFSFTVMAVYYVGRWLGYYVWIKSAWPPDGFWREVVAGFYGRNLIDMAYYWGVLAVGFSLDIYHRYRREELKSMQLESRLIRTELQALRQQLHPHFLFNTLNTVAVLVRDNKPDAAVTLLARLGSLLRMSLDQNNTPEVTLQQEMDFLAHYIEIQQLRFSDRLQVNIDVPENARRALIPNLLLQPIVENAILHGVAPKAGPGRVDITGRVESGALHLEVRDDGIGLTREASHHSSGGIGLTNTRERLAKLYGSRARLSLRSKPGCGVTVQIELPYRI